MFTDYIPNEDHTYVFTSGRTSLPIATTLINDNTGEEIEFFNISLSLPASQETGTTTELVYPSTVSVVIIDDDCKNL